MILFFFLMLYCYNTEFFYGVIKSIECLTNGKSLGSISEVAKAVSPNSVGEARPGICGDLFSSLFVIESPLLHLKGRYRFR